MEKLALALEKTKNHFYFLESGGVMSISCPRKEPFYPIAIFSQKSSFSYHMYDFPHLILPFFWNDTTKSLIDIP